MTEKAKFQNFLRTRHFTVSESYAYMPLVPHHYKDENGNHLLLSNTAVSMFDGVNTPEGGLGCVCFYLGGIVRSKHCRNTYKTEALKKVILPKTAKEAIQEFNNWVGRSLKTRQSWTKIL